MVACVDVANGVAVIAPKPMGMCHGGNINLVKTTIGPPNIDGAAWVSETLSQGSRWVIAPAPLPLIIYLSIGVSAEGHELIFFLCGREGAKKSDQTVQAHLTNTLFNVGPPSLFEH